MATIKDVNKQIGINVTNIVTTPVPTIPSDGDLALGRPGFTGFNTLKVAPETQIFQEGWSDGLDLVDVWNQTETGTGTVVVVDSEGTFTVLASGDEASIQTKLPHIFFHGFSTLWRLAAFTDLATIPTGLQEFGPFNADNGYFFRIDATGLHVVIRRKTVDTVIDVAGFTSGRHGYAIQFLDGNQVRFYVDGVRVHSAISATNNLIANSNLLTTISNRQTSAGAGSILRAFGLAVIREGAPQSFNDAGELRVTSGAISTPPGASKVLRPVGDPLIEMSPNEVIDDFFTITNNKSLIIQVLKGRIESAGVGKSVRIELFSDPDGDNPVGPSDNQPASWIRIDTLMGNNVNESAIQDITLPGDGTARVVLRLNQIGSASVAALGIWQGFEL